MNTINISQPQQNTKKFPTKLEPLHLNLSTETEEAFIKRQKSHRENVSQTIILPILKKFIYLLKKPTAFYKLKSEIHLSFKKKSPSFKFKSLEQKDFDLINDNSYFHENHLKISQVILNFKEKETCFYLFNNKILIIGCKMQFFDEFKKISFEKMFWRLFHKFGCFSPL